MLRSALRSSAEYKDYAGFWRRWVADLLDIVVLAAITTAISALPHSGVASALLVVAYLIGGNWWRIGYRVLGLKIISIDGSGAKLGQLIVRLLVTPLSFLALGLGFFWIAGDPNRQAWHDKIAGTYVIRQAAKPTRTAEHSRARPINWRLAVPCMLVGLGPPLASIGGFLYWLANSNAYRAAKAYLQDHPAIATRVGRSPQFARLPSGQIEQAGTEGQAVLEFDVRGDVGELVARVALVRNEGLWEVVEAGYYEASTS